jgi:septin family protein
MRAGHHCVCDSQVRSPAAARIEKTVTITPWTIEIVERGVNVRVTIIDTPGQFLHCLMRPGCVTI